MNMNSSQHPVVFFDGVCNLCNRTVQFIIRHDKEGIFRFAALQSGPGAEVRDAVKAEYGYVPDSIILSYKGKYYIRSSAALKIAMLLGGIGWLLAPGYLFPRFIRNAVYHAIAKRRYKWFGKRDECMVPTPELRSRFLDG